MSVREVREVCEKNEVLRRAAPSIMTRLSSQGTIRKYQKGELIFREREEVKQLCFLVEGYVALFRMNRNHDRKVIFVFGEHELLNEVIAERPVASISCTALTDTKILTFSRKYFLEMMAEDAGLAMGLMDSMAVKLRRCYRQLGNTPNAMRLDRQVASKLWKLGRDFGKEEDGRVKIRFELTITFLADMVGAKRETISRVVKKLSDENLLTVQKNYFYLNDLDALREYGTSREEQGTG